MPTTTPPRRWPLRFNLRSRLAMLALLLLALPWVGFQYIQEMERFLMKGQRQGLMATARAVATSLHDRPGLMETRPRFPQPAIDIAKTLLPDEELIEAAPRSLADEAQPPQQAVAEIEAIVRSLERASSRIWVINRNLHVLALAGSLRGAAAQRQREEDEAAQQAPIWQRSWSRLLSWVVPAPGDDFDDSFDEGTLATRNEIYEALLGAAGSRVRKTHDEKALIVSAAHPIWGGDRVLGVVVVEESTNPILSLRNQAFGRLLLLTVIGFFIAAVTILAFTSRLSSRIRRLRDETENAINPQGHINAVLPSTAANDEIGDLARSFSALLERLNHHHFYLENLSRRLSHELRTPIAVVRSSLENLRLEGPAPPLLPYVDRAEAGLTRLSRILARMSEATRMEQALASSDSVHFDLCLLVGECLNGYRLAYPQQDFVAHLPKEPVQVRGTPDLAAQMFDKLIENAVDFALAETSIRISLSVAATTVALSVSNVGPPLPEQLEGRLFDSMVSARPHSIDSEPHLGLGLYVARIIATFHGGRLRASNLPDNDGVCFTAELPRV